METRKQEKETQPTHHNTEQGEDDEPDPPQINDLPTLSETKDSIGDDIDTLDEKTDEKESPPTRSNKEHGEDEELDPPDPSHPGCGSELENVLGSEQQEEKHGDSNFSQTQLSQEVTQEKETVNKKVTIIGPHTEDICRPSATAAAESVQGNRLAKERIEDRGGDTFYGNEVNVEMSSNPPGADDEGHGCNSIAAVRNEEPTQEFLRDNIDSLDEKTDEKESPPTHSNKEHGEDDEPGPTDPFHPGYGSELENVLGSEQQEEKHGDSDFSQTQLSQEVELEKEPVNKKVTIIGPTTEDISRPSAPAAAKSVRGRRIHLILAVSVAVVGILVHWSFRNETPLQTDLKKIDIFLRELENIKPHFPNQRPELWSRSRIHLQRHLQTAQPTEPVSLILTAGLRAKKTLQCFAKDLASAFSSALNASVLQIDGASKASQDSDQVKLDIDSQLQGAFEGDKPVAVIHRFEELPPGSTLIFYRYCDHENAAYKKTFLIFTVLLGEEEEISSQIPLNAVEEMVDDHLQKKFLSRDQPVAFDRMDLDKYGGLWSRISHLILPVAVEKMKEQGGCQ